MYYSVALKAPSYDEDTEWSFSEDNFIDNVIVPKEKEVLFKSETSEFLGLCGKCEMACCSHPLDEEGRKWCSVMFHDLIRPKWKLRDLV